MIGFDPMYFVIVGPAILLAIWAQAKVHGAYARAREVPASSGLTGAQVAARILARSGVNGVGVEPVEGMLSDHYDPHTRTLRLSHDVYHGRSLAALGVAAHEAGHALQHGSGYLPLKLRNGIVPLAAIGGNLSWILLLVGFLLASAKLVLAGILLFSATTFFQIVNLPVEFDASRRARELLVSLGLIHPAEDGEVKRVLSAAAMTYVAATLTSVLTLLYYVLHYQGLTRDDA